MSRSSSRGERAGWLWWCQLSASVWLGNVCIWHERRAQLQCAPADGRGGTVSSAAAARALSPPLPACHSLLPLLHGTFHAADCIR